MPWDKAALLSEIDYLARQGSPLDHGPGPPRKSLESARMSEDPLPAAIQTAEHNDAEPAESVFHGWRLIGFIMCVVVMIAIISAVVDWAVIGPLEGRAY